MSMLQPDADGIYWIPVPVNGKFEEIAYQRGDDGELHAVRIDPKASKEVGLCAPK